MSVAALEGLILKRLRLRVDAVATRAISFRNVAALDDKSVHYSVDSAP